MRHARKASSQALSSNRTGRGPTSANTLSACKAVEGGSERELRPTAIYRKVTGGFRSDWGADLFAAILNTLRGQAVLPPG